MLGLDKTQVFWPGAVLTSVIDMYAFVGNSNTSFYCFLKVIFICLFILMGCLTLLKVVMTEVTWFSKIT